MGKVAWTDGALNGQQKELFQILVNCNLNKFLISNKITDTVKKMNREKEVNRLILKGRALAYFLTQLHDRKK